MCPVSTPAPLSHSTPTAPVLMPCLVRVQLCIHSGSIPGAFHAHCPHAALSLCPVRCSLLCAVPLCSYVELFVDDMTTPAATWQMTGAAQDFPLGDGLSAGTHTFMFVK